MADIRKVDLNLLVTLSVLLEEKNVTRTAQRLALTQPTVSGMLGRLRDIFDDPLFVRTQHGMVSTPRAEALAPALNTLLKDVDTLISPDEFDPVSAKMDFRFAATDYFQSTVLVPFIEKFRAQAKQSRLAVFNLDPIEIDRQLTRGDLDLVVTVPDFIDPTLRTQKLYREEYVCAVRESHPVTSSRISMEQFLEYDHVIVSPSGGHFHSPVDEALGRLGKKRKVKLSMPNFLIALEVLQTDNLIALLPKRLLKNRSLPIRLFKPPLELEGYEVVAAWHSRSQHDAAHKWLRKTLADVMKNV